MVKQLENVKGCAPAGGARSTKPKSIYRNIHVLVGGLEHFLFFHILGIIIPTDFHIFQRGGYTTNQVYMYNHVYRNMMEHVSIIIYHISVSCKYTDVPLMMYAMYAF